MSRSIAQFARSIGVDEVTVRSQVNRGYRFKDLELIYGRPDSAAKVAGEAIEAGIRRHLRKYGTLPCGGPIRVCNGKSPKAVRQYEHDVWRSFQFETGTNGDSLMSGADYDPR